MLLKKKRDIIHPLTECLYGNVNRIKDFINGSLNYRYSPSQIKLQIQFLSNKIIDTVPLK